MPLSAPLPWRSHRPPGARYRPGKGPSHAGRCTRSVCAAVVLFSLAGEISRSLVFPNTLRGDPFSGNMTLVMCSSFPPAAARCFVCPGCYLWKMFRQNSRARCSGGSGNPVSVSGRSVPAPVPPGLVGNRLTLCPPACPSPPPAHQTPEESLRHRPLPFLTFNSRRLSLAEQQAQAVQTSSVWGTVALGLAGLPSPLLPGPQAENSQPRAGRAASTGSSSPDS